jgi:DNA-binding NarL/FixJ family response regulator
VGADVVSAAQAADANPLTEREIEVLNYLASGARNAEAAAELGISVKTIEFHVGNVLDKLGARSRTEALLMARRLGYLPPE